jgi:AhpC/TSA family
MSGDLRDGDLIWSIDSWRAYAAPPGPWLTIESRTTSDGRFERETHRACRWGVASAVRRGYCYWPVWCFRGCPVSPTWDATPGARSRGTLKTQGGRGASLESRVIDVETRKPIAGASVVVALALPSPDPRMALPGPVITTGSTGADGRFRLTFTPEQAASTGLSITLQVSHPDYIVLETWPLDLASLIGNPQGPLAHGLQTMTLARGLEFTSRVVTPAGKPLAGLECRFLNWTQSNHPGLPLQDRLVTKTDADGKFRIRMCRTGQLALYLAPDEHALFQRFWGVDDLSQQPDVRVPADLGEIVLEQGTRLFGRPIDCEGRPVSGQIVTAVACYGNFAAAQHRSATTDENGRFTFAPLRPGNFLLHGQAQSFDPHISDDNGVATGRSGVFVEPVRVYVRRGDRPAPVLLRASETVSIECRWVDSKDRPVRKSRVSLAAELPRPPPKPRPVQAAVEQGYSTRINGPELEDRNPLPSRWSADVVSDDEGRAVFQVPPGLPGASIWTCSPDPRIVIKARSAPGQPLLPTNAVKLGQLTQETRGVTFVFYKAPTLRARLRNEAGELPLVNVQLQAGYTNADGVAWTRFTLEEDETFLGRLFPDREYSIAVWAPGLIPIAPVRVKLKENDARDITIPLRTKPEAPRVGDVAPPFWVKTLDGEALSLADVRSRFVLIQFWQPFHPNSIPAIPAVKKVRERFGNKRLAVLGFCMHTVPAEARRGIDEKRVDWPQVLLTDLAADPIVLGYDVQFTPRTYLIGPDGTIAAGNVQGDEIEEVVARALAQN